MTAPPVIRAGHRRAATQGSKDKVTRLTPRNYTPLKENPPTLPGGAALQEGDIVAIYEDGRHLDMGAITTFTGQSAVVATASGKLLWADQRKLVLLARRKSAASLHPF